MNLRTLAKSFSKLALSALLVILFYQIVVIHNTSSTDYIKAVSRILFFSLILVYLIDFDKIIKLSTPKRFNLILNIIIGLVLFLYFFIPIMNHLNFRESGLDLGIYDQALWKYAHFRGFSNTIDGFWGIKNILGDHFELILMLISPLYWLWPNIITLHLFNGLVIVFGSYLLYRLSMTKLNNDSIHAKMIVLIFLLFSGLEMAFMEGQFHPLVFVPILIIAIVYFIEREKWWAYWLMLILLLTIKESMGLYAVFIGVYLILTNKKYWKIALITAGIGIAHYLITVREVAILYGGKYRYFNYNRLGSSNLQIIKTIITKPFYTVYVFFSPLEKIGTMFLILGSFGFAVISMPLIIAVPMFAERFLSSDEHFWWFFMHYNTPLAGALICSLVFFLYSLYFATGKNRLYKYLASKISITSMIVFVLSSTILININYRSDILRFFYHLKSSIIIDRDSRDLGQAIKLIPKNASVSAQNALITHFTERDLAYEFPVVKDASYIVASSAKDHWPMEDTEFKKLLKSYVDGGSYGIKYLNNKTLILEKNYHGELNVIPESFFN